MLTAVATDPPTTDLSTSPSVFSSSLFQLDIDPTINHGQPSQPRRRRAAMYEDIDLDRTPSKFIRKLYKLLDEECYPTTISWCSTGDSFIVKNVEKFTRSILPHTFMHSNFASFVRQLTDHGFHRIKDPDAENAVERHSWAFRHPDFHKDGYNALVRIRRNIAVRASAEPYRASLLQALQEQHACMRQQREETKARIQLLKEKVDSLFDEMARLERIREEQENAMRHLAETSSPGGLGGNESME